MAKHYYDNNWYSIKELSDISGIEPATIRARLRQGYSIEQAVQIVPTHDSILAFVEASDWEDYFDISIEELYNIYWNFCIKNDYPVEEKQNFSRQLKLIRPFKTVPMIKQGKAYRMIRRANNEGKNPHIER